MAAAGLRPCHLNSRNSTTSQVSHGSCQAQLHAPKGFNRPQTTGKHHPSSLLECPNSLSGVDDRRLALSQQKLNLICMIQFATSLMAALNCINKQSFQVFKLKIGVNTGSVTAGIIGAQRPFYDIWGDCVNVSRSLRRRFSSVRFGSIRRHQLRPNPPSNRLLFHHEQIASRMESLGEVGRIQVEERTAELLMDCLCLESKFSYKDLVVVVLPFERFVVREESVMGSLFFSARAARKNRSRLTLT